MDQMRITISHERTKAEVMKSIDRSLNDILHGPSGLPIKLTIECRNWEGSILTFAATAKMGFMGANVLRHSGYVAPSAVRRSLRFRDPLCRAGHSFVTNAKRISRLGR
jgi:hypothetical protein